jgi:hypothetical protein
MLKAARNAGNRGPRLLFPYRANATNSVPPIAFALPYPALGGL